MNYVKKLFKKKLFKNKLDYLILIALVICVFVVLLILQIRNSKKIVFLSVIDHYSYVLTSDQEVKEPIEFSLKCSRDDTMYLDKEMINTVYLYDQVTQDSYQVLIEDITLLKNKYYYQNNGYYDYLLKLKIPFMTTNEIKLANFYLRFEYHNDEKINFKMGSLAFLIDDNSYQNEFVINSLKGIVNEVNKIETLVGLNLQIQSKSANVILESIEAISSKVQTNLTETKIIDYELSSTDDIEKILEKDYDLFQKCTNKPLNINLDEKINLFIPLTYQEYCQIKVLGFIIHYQISEQAYSQIIYPFKFFETSVTPEIEKMSYNIT